MSQPLQIRDFVYLDAERLKSLLSQLGEGLVTQVEQEVSHQAKGEGSIGGGLGPVLKLGGSGGYLWERRESETRTLHDHVYTVLESKLAAQRLLVDLREVPQTRTADAVRALRPGDLVLARGNVLLNNWDRTIALLRDFKRIETAVSALASQSAPRAGAPEGGAQTWRGRSDEQGDARQHRSRDGEALQRPQSGAEDEGGGLG